MDNKKTNIIAGAILFFLLVVSLASTSLTSLTFDEKAHIPAGYSYLKYQDYRINPEHPPLIKSFSAVPLLFLDLNFPLESSNWQQKDSPPQWWVQFDLGDEFIYQSNNNPRQIILWSRFAMILMLLFLGWFLFHWAREIGGNKTGLMALVLFSFSPTLIAHGQLVTTDVGAALGVVLATRFWLRFLEKPVWKNVLLASLFLGIGLLFKFSLALLIPFLGIITFIHVLLNSPRNLIKIAGLSLAIGVIALTAVIWPIYAFHTHNYPIEQQIRDTRSDLAPNPTPFLRDIVYSMTENNSTRSLAQYFRGLLMATQRTGFGNTVYLLGEISAKGWWYYFPVVYLLKEPLALHLLSLIVLFFFFSFLFKKRRVKDLVSLVLETIRNNFTLFSFLVFIVIYWTAALIGNLNIGTRHLIPTLPFVYLIISEGVRRISLKRKRIAFLFSGCFVWYIFSSLSSFPHYIPYYNELAGGSDIGYLHAVDSNYDWGQDFYRLISFVNDNDIEKIHLDYFGGENPEYWLREKYQKLEPRKIKSSDEIKGWVAISTNHLMGGLGKPAPGFDQETGFYQWLGFREPFAKAGKSIFIYYFNDI
jgi:hypothetical protein